MVDDRFASCDGGGPTSPDGDVDFPCPRCGLSVTERFYGPCGACRVRLGATVGRDSGGAGALGASRFEPGMNVVANHVATKD